MSNHTECPQDTPSRTKPTAPCCGDPDASCCAGLCHPCTCLCDPRFCDGEDGVR